MFSPCGKASPFGLAFAKDLIFSSSLVDAGATEGFGATAFLSMFSPCGKASPFGATVVWPLSSTELDGVVLPGFTLLPLSLLSSGNGRIAPLPWLWLAAEFIEAWLKLSAERCDTRLSEFSDTETETETLVDTDTLVVFDSRLAMLSLILEFIEAWLKLSAERCEA